MVINETLTRIKSNRERLVYQMITSEAICLKEEGFCTVYSVLVVRVDGDTVIDSALAYDISRRREVCLKVMRELCENGAKPQDIKEAAAELL